ncbi:MAG: hypothetical protein KDD46_02990 [Bdellovibrionales bacterium]|nr:hypothetical protein [Bdellovibrionales bacterium]
MALVGQISQTFEIPKPSITVTMTDSGRYETVPFSLFDHDFRLVLKDNHTLTFSSKTLSAIAFRVEYDEALTNRSVETIIDKIRAYQPKKVEESSIKKGYKPLFKEDSIQKKSDTISTADVLGWNRLLKNAYQGNSFDGSSSGSGSGSASDTNQGANGLDTAASMAKMMNQCGGNNKSHQAHKQALKNIAEALVMNQVKPGHEIARASESYTDQSRNYQKAKSESILEKLEKMKNIDVSQLYQDIQVEKRNIEKALSRNELSYLFTDNPTDQNSLKMLNAMIETQQRLPLLQKFQNVGRKFVIDAQYFEMFAKFPQRSFIYISAKDLWAVNPLLDSPILYRKALVEMLWSHINKS